MTDLLRDVLRNIRAHKLRFALTSLGIFWGATMLTYLSATAIGSERSFQAQLERTGPKVVWAMSGTVTKDRVGERDARPLELERDDVGRLDAFSHIERSSPELWMWNKMVRSGPRTRLLNVVGVDSDGLAIRNFEIAEGRPIEPLDVERSRRVAFLGAEAKQRLFAMQPAVGRTVRIEGIPFRVVGVAVRKGDQLIHMGGKDDEIVLIPDSAAIRELMQHEKVARFIFEPTTRDETASAIRSTRELTALHHHFDPDDEVAMAFVDVKTIYDILDVLFKALRVFLVGVGLVTMCVGAIGVMNIMLVVVGERTQEIGVRKALGATDRAIFALFLGESVAVAGVSGLAGAALGAGFIQLTRTLIDAENSRLAQPVFDLGMTAFIVATLFAVGLLAGVLPALRAARVEPSESLRAT